MYWLMLYIGIFNAFEKLCWRAVYIPQNRNINQELKLDHVHIGIECSENLTGSCEVSKNEAVQTWSVSYYKLMVIHRHHTYRITILLSNIICSRTITDEIEVTNKEISRIEFWTRPIKDYLGLNLNIITTKTQNRSKTDHNWCVLIIIPIHQKRGENRQIVVVLPPLFAFSQGVESSATLHDSHYRAQHVINLHISIVKLHSPIRKFWNGSRNHFWTGSKLWLLKEKYYLKTQWCPLRNGSRIHYFYPQILTTN